jgi:predicted nucleic acid-binding protein
MQINKDVVVIDANIAIKWVVEEADSHVADILLTELLSQRKLIAVPALFFSEITNILLKKVRQNFLTIARAREATALLLNTKMEIHWPVDPQISMDALEIAYTHNLPATYNAHYLALAEREQCEFWTADERLYNSVKEHLSWVRLMSDLASVSVADSCPFFALFKNG